MGVGAALIAGKRWGTRRSACCWGKVPFGSAWRLRQPFGGLAATRGCASRAMITIRTEGSLEPMHLKSRRRFVVAAGVPTVLALTVGGLLVTQGADASHTIAINVDASQSLGVVPS